VQCALTTLEQPQRQICARVVMPLKLPSARAKARHKKNTGILEQNEEVHASTI